ncbi:hypothetical protein R3P38DRAFT_2824090 [Favolaschia claudopus]|uniref:YMC020W-like alpha/beta hydrolase domain-containing protein n=1 Tax=Favolaschia claudopus TaxID=2862362 RepID=A0AAW0EJ37_9AGAR
MSALDSSSPTEQTRHKPRRRSRHPSTASIRSTASTRSPRPGVWRPPNPLRNRTDSLSSGTSDPRISRVVAGAEISTSAESVRDRMEAFNVTTAPVAGPSSSPSPSTTSDLPPITDSPSPLLSEDESDDMSATVTLATPGDSNVNPMDSTASVAFPVSASPRASSWFGSLSRAKGKERLVEVQATASAPNLLSSSSTSSASIPIPAPNLEPSVSEPTTSSNPSAPERTDPLLTAAEGAQSVSQSPASQKAALAKRSWFSSSPVQSSPLRATSPPQRVPPPIHIPTDPPPPMDDPSVPSSIDSSVPLPVATPPADTTVSFPLSDGVLLDDGNGTVRGRQRLSSLNPSTGRFGIHLPLLGGHRAAAATTVVGTEDTTRVSTANETTTITTTQTSETSETATQGSTTTVRRDTLETRVTSTTTNLPNVTDSGVQMNEIEHHSSWWDYVGWGAAQPTTQLIVQDTTDLEDGGATPKPAHKPIPENSEQPPENGAAPSSEESDAKTIGPSSPAPPTITVSHDEEQASWLYPWTWYGTTQAPPPTSSPSVEDNNAEKLLNTEDAPAGTATEPEPRPASPGADVSSADSAATAAQQRYWTSFFTSSYSQSSGMQSPVNGASSPLRASTSLPAEVLATAPADSVPPESELRQTTSSLSLNSNPIGESISSNRSGWVSFLSSGTLGYVSRKPVTSGEPEVMEIEFEEGNEGGKGGEEPTSPPQTAAPPPVDKPNLSKKDNTNKAQDVKTAPASKKETTSTPEIKPSPSNGTVLTVKPTPEKKQTAPPLTISETVKRQVANNTPTGSIRGKRATSPSPSVVSKSSTGTKTPAKAPSIAPPKSPVPNLVLPTWADTFHAPPRSVVPPRLLDNGKTVGRVVMEKTMRFVSGVLFAADSPTVKKRSSSANHGKGKGKDREERDRDKRYEEWGLGLPRAWDILKPSVSKGDGSEAKEGNVEDVLRGAKNVAVIGIHGWFPGALIQSVLGEPTGTSSKFVNMLVAALEDFQSTYNVKLEKITRIPLEGEGTIERRVEKLYTALTSNSEWMDAIHGADVIFVATHSQGTIVSTHILDRLIREKHIRTGGSDVSKDPSSLTAAATSTATANALPAPPPQRVCCLALAGVSQGPLRYLSSSSLFLPYIQYFENAAAKELFEFQNTENEVSKTYVNALRNVLDNGTKIVYVASLNDQVVPIYSGLFTAASHPLILRALYIDGDAYHSSDFLSNLLVLLIRMLNAGLTDSGLIMHLSEATAGSLNGVGHSTVYEELSTYSLAVKYLFLTNSGFDTHPKLEVEPFNAATEQNDYEIPWSLRDLIAQETISYFFSKEIIQLAGAFRHWHPKTTILRDIKRKLQPIQRLPSSFTPSADAETAPATSTSKL